MDCASSASTTFDAVNSTTDCTSSRVGCGLERTLSSNVLRKTLEIPNWVAMMKG